MMKIPLLMGKSLADSHSTGGWELIKPQGLHRSTLIDSIRFAISFVKQYDNCMSDHTATLRFVCAVTRIVIVILWEERRALYGKSRTGNNGHSEIKHTRIQNIANVELFSFRAYALR